MTAQIDAVAAIDMLLPMFRGDLDAVDAAVDKALAELTGDGTVTERHRQECMTLHAEIVRRRAV